MTKPIVSKGANDVGTLLSEALAHHKAGRLNEAGRKCRLVLKADPSNAVALALMGTLHAQQRDFQGAIPILLSSLKSNPKQPQTLDTLGNALRALGRHKEALNCYDKAIALRPDFAHAFYDRGIALQLAGRTDDAVSSYDKAIALKADLAGAHHNRGNALADLGRHSEALESYDRALLISDRNPESHNNRGNSLRALGRLADALDSYDKALKIKPDYFEAHGNRAIALQALDRPEDALESYDRAIALNDKVAELHSRRGDVLRELERWREAVMNYDKSLELQPGVAEVHHNRGLALQMGGWFSDAVWAYEKVIELKPTLATAHNNLGNILSLAGRHERAMLCFEKAIALNPDYAEAYNNLGITLRELHRSVDALINVDQAILLKPDFAKAHYVRANLLRDMKRQDLALPSYDRALELDPKHAEAHHDRALLLQDLKKQGEALAGFERALEEYPEIPNALGFRLGLKLAMCDWENLEDECNTLIEEVKRRPQVTPPFGFMSVLDDPALQLKCAEGFAPKPYPMFGDWNAPGVKRRTHDRIRVAYLSADFRTHAVAFLVAGMIEQHDREKFELFGISLVPDDGSAMRARLGQAFEHFIEVHGQTDEAIAEMLYENEIDIAVDLTAYTRDARFGVFLLRPAPIQVNYLGYPGTMATECMDYIIADKIVIPEDDRQYFTEKVVYLPDQYQSNDSKRAIGETPTRAAVGLPEDAFVFCCFNNNAKIKPEIFDIWMRLLHHVDGSVLWLMQSSTTAAQNLRREVEKRGIAPERLVLARSATNPDHLARHRLADLFLDTLPYGAHTTASDALWTGLPVLTCQGKSFPARVGSSLLNAIGLPELVTYSLAEYEACALHLARNRDELAAIRAKLLRNRDTYPLFDTVRFARNMEAAFVTMHERYNNGLPPESFAVDAGRVP